MNKRTRKSLSTSNISNSNSYADQPHWSEASSSEEEEIGIRKCMRRSRVDIINEEVKGWTSQSKEQEDTPERTNTKYEIRLEEIKER